MNTRDDFPLDRDLHLDNIDQMWNKFLAALRARDTALDLELARFVAGQSQRIRDTALDLKLAGFVAAQIQRIRETGLDLKLASST